MSHLRRHPVVLLLGHDAPALGLGAAVPVGGRGVQEPRDGGEGHRGAAWTLQGTPVRQGNNPNSLGWWKCTNSQETMHRFHLIFEKRIHQSNENKNAVISRYSTPGLIIFFQ